MPVRQAVRTCTTAGQTAGCLASVIVCLLFGGGERYETEELWVRPCSFEPNNRASGHYCHGGDYVFVFYAFRHWLMLFAELWKHVTFNTGREMA